MTAPYYQDDAVTLYCGDSMEILPTLDITADALLTDPPYFKVKQDEWDNQWDKAGEFLGWMGEWLDLSKPRLAANASVWVFASPAMTSSVERVVGERFRVLNSIRWVKEAGWHQKAELKAMRRYLTPWEGVVLAEQDVDVYADADYWARKLAFKDAGQYLERQRVNAGRSRLDVAQALYTQGIYSSLGSARSNVSMQEDGQKRLSERAYEAWSTLVDLKPYDEMLRDYERSSDEHGRMRQGYETTRRPFNITERAVSTDVWTFPAVKPYKGKHPCEKPQPMLRHMIETSTRPGATVLDPFAGSGSTILAAKSLGRKSVAIEKDEQWCERIALKLSENTLDLGEAA